MTGDSTFRDVGIFLKAIKVGVCVSDVSESIKEGFLDNINKKATKDTNGHDKDVSRPYGRDKEGSALMDDENRRGVNLIGHLVALSIDDLGLKDFRENFRGVLVRV